MEEPTYEILYGLKANQHWSNNKIALHLNVNRRVIDKLIHKYNIKYKEKDIEILKSLWIEYGDIKQLSEICKTSKQIIKDSLMNFGIIEDTRLIRKCSVCGKESNQCKSFRDILYCKKHYNHMYRYGKIIESTIYDNNDYIFEEDVIKITLKNRYQDILAYAIIDSEDFDKIKKYKWYLKKQGMYCVTKGIDKESPVSIQDVVMDNLDSSFKTINKYDHIDNNGLNNIKYNLRKVSHQENAFNMKKKATNTSGVTGVAFYDKDSSPKWSACICVDYKSIYLGRYESFDDSVKERIKAEAKYFGIYSNNYNKETNLLELTYVSQDDNLLTTIHCSLDSKIMIFKKER